ncbi:MAG: dihydroorotase [Emcibacteraceae bacterium]|nr:dihydroorotase [Emcibacteraceae bacterium]MDG1996824.1 dihydroorotase [Emcibacteraceae bacterium]
MSNITHYINARLLDPASNLDIKGELLTENDKIAAIGEKVAAPANATVVDLGGKCLSPGLVDMRVFVGIPGADYKDTISNTGEAAAAGGVTTVCVQPNTDPIIDSLAHIEYLAIRAKDALVNFVAMPAATKQMEGTQMSEIGLMSRAGHKVFGDCSSTIANPAIMNRIFKYASTFDALIVQHLAEPNLSKNGCMNAGDLATRLGMPGIPTAAETLVLERDVRLLKGTQGRYHASQVTCADSIEVLEKAKSEGLNVTAGVAVPHLSLNEYAIEDYRTFMKMSPPLRGEDDRVAVVEALKNGTIDVIVSGHDPEDPESKRVPFEQAEPGVVGLETLLKVCLEMYHNGSLSLLEILSKLTSNPAKIMGLDCGQLKVGAPADLCIFDLNTPHRIDAEKMVSITKNTCFDGKPVQGRVIKTVVGGECVYSYDG